VEAQAEFEKKKTDRQASKKEKKHWQGIKLLWTRREEPAFREAEGLKY